MQLTSSVRSYSTRASHSGQLVLFTAGASSNQESEVIAACMRTALSVDRCQSFGGEDFVRTPDCEFAIASSVHAATRFENPSRNALS
jgi:hypothetical protein